jgi:hypothetical protein
VKGLSAIVDYSDENDNEDVNVTTSTEVEKGESTGSKGSKKKQSD